MTSTTLLIILGIAAVIFGVVMRYRSENTRTASEEFTERFHNDNRQDMMRLKSLFGTASKNEPKRFTVDNVLEYLRREGFQPERDPNDDKIVIFKFQGDLLMVGVTDNFCRIFGIWEAKQDENNMEAMYTASMTVMDHYRFVRIVYRNDVLEFGVDHMISSMEHFEELFNISLSIIGECRRVHLEEYVKLAEIAVGDSESDEDEARRKDIYQPEFRWMPDVLLKAVQTKQIVPDALTDEEWLRRSIQERTSSGAMAQEWESFKINRVENYGEYKLIVYQFPEPKIVPEAKYGAVLLNTDSMELNYYTLELSFDNKWVYGSMTSERHANYGSYNTPDLDKFIEWIFSKDKNFEGGVDYTKQQQIN